jgi:putative ABC transport system permease protein
MGALIHDLKYGLRMLAKNPGFTAVAVVTLALGIGANTAIFSVVNALFLHPPGIPNPDQLVVLRAKYDKLGLKNIAVSVPDFAQIRDRKDVFASAAISDTADFNYAAGEWPQRLLGATVTWQWFNVFDARPMLGRVFTSEEDHPGANHEVVLAYGTWKQWFGGDPGIVGRSIRLNEQSYRVVGVMGPAFQLPPQVALWTPMGLAPGEFAPDKTFNERYFAVARLRPNVSVAQASAAVALLTKRVVDNPISSYAKDSGWGMFIVPLVRFAFGDLQAPLLILAVAVGFVLLIACANIAGLLLARATGRAREFAVRSALGAPRRRLLFQMLAESAPLALGGALVGTFAAMWGIQALLLAVPEGLMPGAKFPLDGNVLAFTLAATVLAAVIFGIAPAWQASSADPYGAILVGGRTATGDRVHQRFRSALVVGELALALVLLAGTGLLLESLSALSRVSPGFEPKGVMTAALALPKVKYSTPEKQMDFFRNVLDRLSAAPGVTMAAAGVPLPFSGSHWSASFNIWGRSVGPGSVAPHGDVRLVTPGFFKTLGIPVLRGRTFSTEDRQETQPVAVIDQDLAKQYWPGQDPIGQKIRSGDHEAWAVIVGVVGHIRFSSLAGEETSGGFAQSGAKGAYYYPMYQTVRPYGYLLAQTSGDPAALAGALRSAVRDVDPDQPVHDLQTMEERIWGSLGPQRFSTTLLGVFAGMAILLAAVGLYGVISYGVAQRTHEIGIRMALGAERRDVLKLVVTQGLHMALIGVTAGIAVAVALTRFLSSLLFGVEPTDPLTYIAVSLILIAVALAACYIPARRATKVDPMVALRYE